MTIMLRQDGRQGILPFVIVLGEREDITVNPGFQ